MTHVFKPGRYKTRDGREAVVLCDDAPGDYPVVGYVHRPSGSGVIPETWKSDGLSGVGLRDRDLMPPVTEPEQVVRWVSLHESGWTTICTDLACAQSHYGYIARRRVTFKPGQFDDESTPDDFTRGWNEALDAACAALKEWGFSEDGSATPCVRALKRSV